MADRRRQRPAKRSQEVLSEGESQHPQSLSLSQSDRGSQGGYVDLSEYETDDEDYRSSQSSEEEEGELEDGGTEGQFDDASEDAGDVERGSGDGKEQSDNDYEPKKGFVNVSEDGEEGADQKEENEEVEKESPCFIPTKGNFFQHDTRSDDVRGGRTTVRNFRTRPDSSRWLHDKFDEHEQTPKSREDLIAEYGYDIRAHSFDKPPPQHRGNMRGQRRPFGRRDMNRAQNYQQQQNNTNSYNKDDRKQWPSLNKERPRLPPSQQKYRDTTIRTQDFRARRNYQGNNQRDREQQYREPRQPLNQQPRTDFSSKPKVRELELQHPPAAPDDEEEEWDVPIRTDAEDKSEKQPPVQKPTKYSAENKRPQPPAYSQQRHGKREGKLTEKLKNISISQSKEQPRRYSSLRQRNANSPTEHSKHQHYAPAPTLPPEWTKKKEKHTKQHNENQPSSSAATSSGHIQTSHLPHEHTGGLPHKNVPVPTFMQPQPQANPSPVPAISSSPAAPYSIADFSSPALDVSKGDPNLLAGGDAAAALATQMQWYETAMAYQAMLSQNVVNHPPPPAALPPLLPQQPSLLPNADQVGASGLMVGEEQKPTPPQIPLVSQAGTPDLGALGSLAFPPPLPHNFTQNDFMQRNMLAERPLVPPMQIPFSHNPGLVGQQVGGVTYYANLPQSAPFSGSPSIMQGTTAIGSPLRAVSSAIPIRPPME